MGFFAWVFGLGVLSYAISSLITPPAIFVLFGGNRVSLPVIVIAFLLIRWGMSFWVGSVVARKVDIRRTELAAFAGILFGLTLAVLDAVVHHLLHSLEYCPMGRFAPNWMALASFVVGVAGAALGGWAAARRQVGAGAGRAET